MKSPAVAFAVYLAAAVAMFGLPVVDHPGTEVISTGTGTDPGIFIWGLQWVPHAIAHGLNPFHTDLLFVPDGYDLPRGTFAPGLGLVLAPVTVAFGPVVSFNLAMLLSPVLAAFFAFLLCRRATGAFAAALLGGWLFGFSAYLLGQLTGHLQLTLVFLVPAIVLLVWRRIDGEIGTAAFVAWLAAALGGQLLVSTEVFLSFTLFGASALVVAWWLAPGARRSAIARTAPPILGAYAVMAVVLSPFLYYALRGGGPLVDVTRGRTYSNDLLAFGFPSEFERLGRRYFHDLAVRFSAGAAEGAAYLGLPLLAIAAAFAVSTWRLWTTRLLIVVAGAAAVLSLGSRLQVAGEPTIPMPWAAFDGLQVLGGMLPARFAMYAVLAVAVMAALWVAAPSPRRGWRWALALLAVAFLFPNLGGGYWHGRPAVPAFFSTPLHERYLKPNDVALVLPAGIKGNSMLWQAQTGLGFRLAGGWVGDQFPSSYEDDPLYRSLLSDGSIPDMAGETRRFLRVHQVDAVVVDEHRPGPWPAILAQLGARPVRTGGVLLFQLPARR